MTNQIDIVVTSTDRSGPGLKSAAQNADKLADSTRRVGEVAGGILAADVFQRIGQAAMGFFKGAIDGARESAKVMATTEQVIKTTGGAANVTAQQVGQLAESLSKKTGIDDEAIQSGSNLILTFKNIRNEVGEGNKIFDRATAAAVDLSAAGFGSIESASKMLGKALNDPIAGMTALGRAGVTFTAAQKAQITAMVQNNDLLGAQRIILEEVESQVGGTAEAQATAADKAKVAYGNLQEAIGGLLLPVIDALATAFSGVAEWLEAIPGPAQAAITVVGGLAAAFFILAPRIVAVRTALSGVAAASPAAARGMSAVGTAAKGIGAALGFVGVAWAAADAIGAIGSAGTNAAPSVDELTDSLIKLADGRRTDEIDRLIEILGGGNEGFEGTTELLKTLDEMDKALAGMVSSGNAELAAESFEQIKQIFKEKGIEFDPEMFTQYQDALNAVRTENQLMGEGAAQTQEEIDAEAEAMQKLADEATTAAEGLLGLRDANRNVEQSFADAMAAIEENGKTLDITTQKGRDNQEAIDNLAGAHLELIQGLIDEKAPADDVSAAMQTMRDKMQIAGQAAGMTEEEVDALVDQLLEVPGDYVAKLKAKNAEEEERKVEQANADLAKFDNKYQADLAVGHQPRAVRLIQAAKNEAKKFDNKYQADLHARDRASGGLRNILGLLRGIRDKSFTVTGHYKTVGTLAKATGGVVGAPAHAAEGGPRGADVLVGEHGPEIAELPFGTRVIPAGQTAARGAGGGGVTEIVLMIDVSGADNDLVNLIKKWFRTGRIQLATTDNVIVKVV